MSNEEIARLKREIALLEDQLRNSEVESLRERKRELERQLREKRSGGGGKQVILGEKQRTSHSIME